MSTPKPVAQARAAAEAIRRINHLTFDGSSELDQPSHVQSTVAALAELASRLPQALDQLDRQMNTLAETGGLYDDRGRSAKQTTRSAVTRMRRAGAVAQSLAAVLNDAASDLSHLGVTR